MLGGHRAGGPDGLQVPPAGTSADGVYGEGATLMIPSPTRTPRSTGRSWGWRNLPLLTTGGLIAVIALLTVAVTGGATAPLDHAVAVWAVHVSTPDIRRVASWTVVAGQRGPVAVVVLTTATALAFCRREWGHLLRPVLAFGALNVVVGAMKESVGRTAPYSGRDQVFVGGTLFPSGHSANSVLMWGALAVTVARAGVVRRRWVLVTAVAGVSIAVGASTVLLSTHWVSDVLAGWAIGGTLLVALTWGCSGERFGLSAVHRPEPHRVGVRVNDSPHCPATPVAIGSAQRC